LLVTGVVTSRLPVLSIIAIDVAWSTAIPSMRRYSMSDLRAGFISTAVSSLCSG